MKKELSFQQMVLKQVEIFLQNNNNNLQPKHHTIIQKLTQNIS